MSDRSESVLDRMMRGLILLGIFGLIDLILFGVIQGNDKTNWIRIVPVGIVYFAL